MRTEFIDKIKTMRIPFYATLKLTYKCNFRCLHCYQTPQKDSAQKELNKDQWFAIIDELKKRKTVVVVFTGGEIFTRKDFIDIYQYAYDKNLKIYLMTNLSLMTDEMLNLFREKKPNQISTTLYGFSESVYRNFTQCPNSFEVVTKNIEKLKDNNINFNIKVIANTSNRDELEAMYEHYTKMNAPFFVYYDIINFNNGENTPKKLELCDDDIAYFQTKFRQVEDYLGYIKIRGDRSGQKCGAGLTAANIDPYGNFYLCESSDHNRWSFFENGFDYCWDKLKEERQREIEVEIPCGGCEDKKYCTVCTPVVKYEYGKLCKPEKHCLYAATLGKLMRGD